MLSQPLSFRYKVRLPSGCTIATIGAMGILFAGGGVLSLSVGKGGGWEEWVGGEGWVGEGRGGHSAPWGGQAEFACAYGASPALAATVCGRSAEGPPQMVPRSAAARDGEPSDVPSAGTGPPLSETGVPLVGAGRLVAGVISAPPLTMAS